MREDEPSQVEGVVGLPLQKMTLCMVRTSCHLIGQVDDQVQYETILVGGSKKWAEGIANLISNQKGSVENVNKLIFLEM